MPRDSTKGKYTKKAFLVEALSKVILSNYCSVCLVLVLL